jgi:hypothetical protein
MALSWACAIFHFMNRFSFFFGFYFLTPTGGREV